MTENPPTPSQRRLERLISVISKLHSCVYDLEIRCHCWGLLTAGSSSLETRQPPTWHSSILRLAVAATSPDRTADLLGGLNPPNRKAYPSARTKCCCMAIHAKVAPRFLSDLSPAVFYSYAVKTLNTLGDFHQTFTHVCRYLTALLNPLLKAMVDLSETVRELIMNSFHLFNSPNSKTTAQTEIDNNNRRLKKAVQNFQDSLFSYDAPNKASRVRVGADAR